MEDKESRKKIWALVAVSLFLVGLLVGYYVMPKDLKTEIRKLNGDYMDYFDLMQESLKPYNETDKVTSYIDGNNIYINHTVPNEHGMKYICLYRDDGGFIIRISQWRDV